MRDVSEKTSLLAVTIVTHRVWQVCNRLLELKLSGCGELQQRRLMAKK
jgi:hypothetical protein